MLFEVKWKSICVCGVYGNLPLVSLYWSSLSADLGVERLWRGYMKHLSLLSSESCTKLIQLPPVQLIFTRTSPNLGADPPWFCHFARMQNVKHWQQSWQVMTSKFGWRTWNLRRKAFMWGFLRASSHNLWLPFNLIYSKIANKPKRCNTLWTWTW